MLGNYNHIPSTALISGDLPGYLAAEQCKSWNIRRKCLPSTSLGVSIAVCLFTCHGPVWKRRRPCVLFKGSFGKQGFLSPLTLNSVCLEFCAIHLLCSAEAKSGEVQKSRETLTSFHPTLVLEDLGLAFPLAQRFSWLGGIYPASSFSQRH